MHFLNRVLALYTGSGKFLFGIPLNMLTILFASSSESKLLSVAGYKQKTPAKAEVLLCREDRIRTCDPLVPNQVRYRPALLPEPVILNNYKNKAVREGFEPSVQI